MSSRRLAAAVCTAAASLLALPAAASAAPEYDNDTVVLKFEPGTPGKQKARALGAPGLGRVVGEVDGVGAHVVRTKLDPARMARLLERNPNVDYAEPNFVMKALATPNDPLYADQWALHNTGQTGGTSDADIDAPEGWDAAGLAGFPATGGAKVGIIDTGISSTHPDLAGKTADCATSYTAGIAIVRGVCEDDNGHGTHVAGTISANTNNGRGVAGVSPNSPLTICKALATAAGTGLTTDIAECIDWTAAQGAKVISMSLGGGESETLRRAVQNAWNGGNGALLIAAAGNDGDATANYPAAYPEVVSVASTDHNDRRSSFSNANADVEIAAPGERVLSTFIPALYIELDGTSMATPHVSGVAAVVFDQNPGATAATVRSRLTSTVDDLGPAGRDSSYGYGRVNLCKAAGGSCSYTPGG